jgi:hypothetical protein
LPPLVFDCLLLGLFLLHLPLLLLSLHAFLFVSPLLLLIPLLPLSLFTLSVVLL